MAQVAPDQTHEVKNQKVNSAETCRDLELYLQRPSLPIPVQGKCRGIEYLSNSY